MAVLGYLGCICHSITATQAIMRDNGWDVNNSYLVYWSYLAKPQICSFIVFIVALNRQTIGGSVSLASDNCQGEKYVNAYILCIHMYLSLPIASEIIIDLYTVLGVTRYK